ncbi:RAD14 [[Candida] subhashii]|uniref:RAD14 n=1 Tax=[Candida] subhashii TaxID=561895 RepID=A0A8J5QFU4_9ASCO|nr:RAD14 [[Candida] subhashii]KAG7660593.1 RAD14 [[Candida] subhashii]
MSFVRGQLTEEQKRRIEANRKRAAERLQKKQHRDGGILAQSNNNISNPRSEGTGNPVSISTKGIPSQIVTTPVQITSSFVEPGSSSKRARIELTDEQRNRIEQNRLKAIEIQARRSEQRNSSSQPDSSSQPQSTAAPADINPIEDVVRLNKNTTIQDSNAGKSKKFEPPPIRKMDYIEYDFATMQDSRGGFIQDDGKTRSVDEQTLEEWKEKQQEQQIIRELPPPIDIDNAPRCFDCNSLEIDPNLYTNFNVRACRKCVKEKPEKYALLTKTECKEDYLLTEPELKDTSLLARIEKPNPHGYSRMQLFVRYQVEEYAWKKWGGPEELDKEWERREQQRLKRKEKKYQDELREMRKKTRAEEYTRKLRNGQGIGERHVHDWSAPIHLNDNIIKKRCIDCGIEIEEVIIL